MSHYKSETARRRYKDNFFFYFSKPINDLISAEVTPLNLIFNELKVYDSKEEIMRRYYTIPETQIRLTNYTASYKEICPFYTPNLCIVKPFYLLLKRMHRIHNFYIREEEFKQRANQVVETGEVVVEGAQKAKFVPLLPSLLRRHRLLSIKDLSEGIVKKLRSNTIYGNSEISEEGSLGLSYETKLHDIYEPSFSSKGTVRSVLIDFVDLSENWQAERNGGVEMVQRGTLDDYAVGMNPLNQKRVRQEARVTDFVEIMVISSSESNSLQKTPLKVKPGTRPLESPYQHQPSSNGLSLSQRDSLTPRIQPRAYNKDTLEIVVENGTQGITNASENLRIAPRNLDSTKEKKKVENRLNKIENWSEFEDKKTLSHKKKRELAENVKILDAADTKIKNRSRPREVDGEVKPANKKVQKPKNNGYKPTATKIRNRTKSRSRETKSRKRLVEGRALRSKEKETPGEGTVTTQSIRKSSRSKNKSHQKLGSRKASKKKRKDKEHRLVVTQEEEAAMVKFNKFAKKNNLSPLNFQSVKMLKFLKKMETRQSKQGRQSKRSMDPSHNQVGGPDPHHQQKVKERVSKLSKEAKKELLALNIDKIEKLSKKQSQKKGRIFSKKLNLVKRKTPVISSHTTSRDLRAPGKAGKRYLTQTPPKPSKSEKSNYSKKKHLKVALTDRYHPKKSPNPLMGASKLSNQEYCLNSIQYDRLTKKQKIDSKIFNSVKMSGTDLNKQIKRLVQSQRNMTKFAERFRNRKMAKSVNKSEPKVKGLYQSYIETCMNVNKAPIQSSSVVKTPISKSSKSAKNKHLVKNFVTHYSSKTQKNPKTLNSLSNVNFNESGYFKFLRKKIQNPNLGPQGPSGSQQEHVLVPKKLYKEISSSHKYIHRLKHPRDLNRDVDNKSKMKILEKLRKSEKRKLKELGGLISEMHISNGNIAKIFKKRLKKKGAQKSFLAQTKSKKKTSRTGMSANSNSGYFEKPKKRKGNQTQHMSAKRKTKGSKSSTSGKKRGSAAASGPESSEQKLEVLVRRLLKSGGGNNAENLHHLSDRYAYFYDLGERKKDGSGQKSSKRK